MFAFSPGRRYFLYRHQAGMRKGFDSLSGLVRDGLQKNPLSGDVFIFFNNPQINKIPLLENLTP